MKKSDSNEEKTVVGRPPAKKSPSHEVQADFSDSTVIQKKPQQKRSEKIPAVSEVQNSVNSVYQTKDAGDLKKNDFGSTPTAASFPQPSSSLNMSWDIQSKFIEYQFHIAGGAVILFAIWFLFSPSSTKNESELTMAPHEISGSINPIVQNRSVEPSFNSSVSGTDSSEQAPSKRMVSSEFGTYFKKRIDENR